jgi:hypothetical protein
MDVKNRRGIERRKKERWVGGQRKQEEIITCERLRTRGENEL